MEGREKVGEKPEVSKRGQIYFLDHSIEFWQRMGHGESITCCSGKRCISYNAEAKIDLSPFVSLRR
jgi:hypothetical protein